jgi:hypothetical protein
MLTKHLRTALSAVSNHRLCIAVAVIVLGMVGAGCASPSRSSSHPQAAASSSGPVMITDPNGQKCPAADTHGQGYCPGDNPTVTDPNGQSCQSLDNQGYCPGDDPQSPMAQWCNGDGSSDWQSATGDFKQLGIDAGSDDISSVESDGAQLAQDAATAEKILPPGTKMRKFDYGYVMATLTIAGIKASSGDITGTDSALRLIVPDKFNAVANRINSACGSS